MNSNPRSPASGKDPKLLHQLPPELDQISFRSGSPSSDPFGLASAGLVERVRALIASRTSVSVNEVPDHASDAGRGRTSAGGTSSYYGDEGESGESGSLHMSELSKMTGLPSEGTWLHYAGGDDGTAQDSDNESFARLREGAVRSVASSIVHTDSQSISRRPIYSHSSVPDDIHRELEPSPKRTSQRALGRVSPTIPSKVGVLGAGDDSSEEGERGYDSDVTEGGIDPEVVRRRILSRPVLQPIQTADPIVGVIFDSPSSRSSPDLFPRPLRIDEPGKRAADTPINSLVTPPPMIGITPPTPMFHTSSSDRDEGADKEDDESSVEGHPSEVIAHTGASTPRAQSTVIGHTGASTPEEPSTPRNTANKGIMPDFDYEEYAQDEYGRPGVSSENVIASSTVPSPNDIKLLTEVGLNKRSPSNTVYSRKDVAQPTYSKVSDQSPRLEQTRSLQEEFTSSDAQADAQASDLPRERSESPSRGRRSRSHNRGKSRVRSRNRSRSLLRVEDPNASSAPLTTQAFSRIIYDLEDMLNQALELAGRAVVDSNSALDASIRSRQGSSATSACGESMRPSTDAGLERAVTAPESIAPYDEEQTKEVKARPVEDVIEEEPSIPSEIKSKIDKTSSVAVYRDDGEPTGESSVDVVARNEKGMVGIADLGRKRSQNVRKQNSLRITRTPSKDRTRSRSSYNSFPTKSSKSPLEGEKFRMEVGRSGEILLIKLPPVSSTTLPSTQEESDISSRPGSNKRTRPGWEWSLNRKRYAAAVTCLIVGLISWIVGNYYAESAAIQEHLKISPYVASLGNSMFFLGIALPTLILWPLPLLHGRKPYLLLSIALLLPLQLPQALSLAPYTSDARSEGRSMHPYVVCFLFFRTMSGVILGFAFMNTLSTITDLFGCDTGACCRGGVVVNPEVPIDGHNQFHAVPGGEAGARMGAFLGFFSYMWTAFPGIGFLFGKITISHVTPAWGFWIVAILGALLLILVALVPEVRPPWSKAKILRKRSRENRRRRYTAHEILERGEIKMVISGRSPGWWWEEVWAGLLLSWQMVTQIGFLVLAIYVGWVFGQVAMVMSLLASLFTTDYQFKSTDIGIAIFILPLASLIAIPMLLMKFYLTNFRHRSAVAMRNPIYEHRLAGEHPYRGSLFLGCFVLPLSSFALTISATGPPVHYIVPILFAALVSFSGTLVIAECHLILLDNWDISDLPEPTYASSVGSTHHGAGNGRLPHGTQRPTSLHSGESAEDFTTCHPAVSSGLAIFHGLSFLFGALTVGCSVYIVNGIGVRSGLGLYTGFTVLVTIALVGVLWRWKEVKLAEIFNAPERETSEQQAAETQQPPVKMVKVSLLQRGKLTRWSEVNSMEYWGNGGV